MTPISRTLNVMAYEARPTSKAHEKCYDFAINVDKQLKT